MNTEKAFIFLVRALFYLISAVMMYTALVAASDYCIRTGVDPLGYWITLLVTVLAFLASFLFFILARLFKWMQ